MTGHDAGRGIAAAGRIDKSRSTAKTRERCVKLGGPAKLFAERFLVDSPGGKVHRADLYRKFLAWCKEEGISIASKGVFNTRLQEEFEMAEAHRVKLGEKKSWCWVSIDYAQAGTEIPLLDAFYSPTDFENKKKLEEESFINTEKPEKRYSGTGKGSWLEEHRKNEESRLKRPNPGCGPRRSPCPRGG